MRPLKNGEYMTEFFIAIFFCSSLYSFNFESQIATVTFDDEKISREKIANTIARDTYFKVTDTEKKSWSPWGWLFGKN